MRGYRARRDRNHAEIAETFRRLGCSWLDLAAVGGGCPDGLVGYGGRSALVEIKDGRKPPSARELTPAQIEFRQSWTGGLHVVTSVEDAISVARALLRQEIYRPNGSDSKPASYARQDAAQTRQIVP